MLDTMTLERGALRNAVVFAIDELGSGAYATNIDRLLCEHFRWKATKLQQIHTALKRMEKQQLVRPVGKDAGEHRRRPRTIYGLTGKGRTELEKLRSRQKNPGHENAMAGVP